jgi:hypothetical protein
VGAVGALTAIWDDLVGAKTYELALAEARRLLEFAAEQGYGAEPMAGRLRDILQDFELNVRLVRGESVEGVDPTARAGADLGELFGLARSVLSEAPRKGEAVVWLRYTLAPFAAVGHLKLSETVSIFSEKWLRAVTHEEATDDLPPELVGENVPFALGSLIGEDEEEDENAFDHVPRALIRIDLGEVLTAEALALARETAELMLSLASLHGADTNIWLLTQDHVVFVDGEETSASFSAPPVFTPTMEQGSAMRSDRLPQILTEWAAELSPHLPLTSPELRRGAQLALWMRRARETWESGRLVLCDRIFEQVAGWTGFDDRRRFIRYYLRPAWALGRVRSEIMHCWMAIYSAGSTPFQVLGAEAWKEIRVDPEIEFELLNLGWSVNLRGVLLRLPFLLERCHLALSCMSV